MLSVFIAGLITGWFGNTWLVSEQTTLARSTADNSYNRAPEGESARERSAETDVYGPADTESLVTGVTVDSPNPLNTNSIGSQGRVSQQSLLPPSNLPAAPSSTTATTITDTFERLLDDRLYRDAISLYHDQKSQNSPEAPQLRLTLIRQLKRLIEARSNSDFSALVEHYLSVYYDDVEVLLLLADFNQINGSHLEVVNVYLLAKTYAYTDIDLQNVTNRFNSFVEEVDRTYTNQRNWWSLINFYSHVDTSGLMTSTYQYLQALAHLRSGDEILAIEQFNQLLSDSVVGESAALALSNLDNYTTAPRVDSSAASNYSETIALQQLGNQYVVNLTNKRQDNIRLLIDTGASMTAISSATFSSLGLSADAVEVDRRVFRTAGGVVTGVVYSVPELQLGSYLLQNTQIAVIDFETESEIDGLLGMNILGQFRFQIDQENAQLQLSEK